MVVRVDQISAMSCVPGAEFVKQIASLLRDYFDDAANEDSEALLAVSQRQVQKAAGYGLDSQGAAASYVITAWIMGEDFDAEFEAASTQLQSAESQEHKAFWLGEWTEQYLAALEDDENAQAAKGEV